MVQDEIAGIIGGKISKNIEPASSINDCAITAGRNFWIEYKWMDKSSSQELAMDIRNLTNRGNPY